MQGVVLFNYGHAPALLGDSFLWEDDSAHRKWFYSVCRLGRRSGVPPASPEVKRPPERFIAFCHGPAEMATLPLDRRWCVLSEVLLLGLTGVGGGGQQQVHLVYLRLRT